MFSRPIEGFFTDPAFLEYRASYLPDVFSLGGGFFDDHIVEDLSDCEREALHAELELVLVRLEELLLNIHDTCGCDDDDENDEMDGEQGRKGCCANHLKVLEWLRKEMDDVDAALQIVHKVSAGLVLARDVDRMN
jgi:hypothetical protein